MGARDEGGRAATRAAPTDAVLFLSDFDVPRSLQDDGAASLSMSAKIWAASPKAPNAAGTPATYPFKSVRSASTICFGKLMVS